MRVRPYKPAASYHWKVAGKGWTHVMTLLLFNAALGYRRTAPGYGRRLDEIRK